MRAFAVNDMCALFLRRSNMFVARPKSEKVTRILKHDFLNNYNRVNKSPYPDPEYRLALAGRETRIQIDEARIQLVYVDQLRGFETRIQIVPVK